MKIWSRIDEFMNHHNNGVYLLLIALLIADLFEGCWK